MENTERQDSRLKTIWNRMMNLKGDKVILIIIILLILISFLAIFSSTPLLPSQSSRLATMKEHGFIVFLGIAVMFVLYHFEVKWIRGLSKWGFIASLGLLSLLVKEIDWGFIKTEEINGAIRNFKLMGKQIHVFEIVKVAMVLYLSWAVSAVNEDMQARKERRRSRTLTIANWLANRYTFLSFLRLTKWKRIVYVYLPSIIVCMMMLKGSGSSAIFVGFILVATMFICGVPWKELALAGLVGIAGFAALFAVYKITDGDKMKRIGTVVSRMSVEYDMNRLEGLEGDEFHNMLDTLRQPVSAKVAIYEGRLLGKHTGNSTQKYQDRKSTRLNSSHKSLSRMPSSA